MPPRMFSVEGMMGLRSWRYADGTANSRAVVAANSSIADGVASALKPRRTRCSPYPAAATARAHRISKTAFQGFMSTSPVPCWHDHRYRTKEQSYNTAAIQSTSISNPPFQAGTLIKDARRRIFREITPVDGIHRGEHVY